MFRPRNNLTKIEKTNIGLLSTKVAHNQLDRMQCKKRSVTVIPNGR